jgi:hypothetical protein
MSGEDPDKSSPRPDMSRKSLWKLAFEPDMSDSGDLTRSDMSENLSRAQVRDRTRLVDRTYSRIGPTSM